MIGDKLGWLKAVKWLAGYFSSSIGRKQTLGLAGLGLVGFLGGHMAGNLQLLNPNLAAAQASYNAYAHFLTGMKPMIWFVEAGLVGILAVHAVIALWLKLSNRKASGASRYAVTARKGDATPAAYTMFASGVVILAFLVQHLLFIKFGTHHLYEAADGSVIRDMWLTTVQTFANPWWTLFYVASLAVAGAHLAHALPSLFRTFGIVHARWTPLFNIAGVMAAVAIIGGYVVTAAGTCALMNTKDGKALIQKSLAAQAQLAAKQSEGVRK